MGVQAAPLAREVSWLPAVENRGEGIFLQFRKMDIDEWAAKPEVKAREQHLRAGFRVWQAHHPQSPQQFPGTAYFFLHTLSHLLLTAIALECGYSTSSIRERVYALDAGYGVFLYTGSPDAEGTLGGLVGAGKNIAAHFRAALEIGGLCSNDPVCAQHEPQSTRALRFLQGAACHGCVLVARPPASGTTSFWTGRWSSPRSRTAPPSSSRTGSNGGRPAPPRGG